MKKFKSGTFKAAREHTDYLEGNPDCIVLHLGINDLKDDDASVESCVDYAVDTVTHIHARSPGTSIVISMLVPRPDSRTADLRHQVFNAQLQHKLYMTEKVSFMNHADIARNDYMINKCFHRDKRHLSAKDGTAIVASNIRKAVVSSLGLSDDRTPRSPQGARRDTRTPRSPQGARRDTRQADRQRENWKPGHRRNQGNREPSRGDNRYEILGRLGDEDRLRNLSSVLTALLGQ